MYASATGTTTSSVYRDAAAPLPASGWANRGALAESNRDMAAEGRFSLASYEKMLAYIEEYRDLQANTGPEGEQSVAAQK